MSNTLPTSFQDVVAVKERGGLEHTISSLVPTLQPLPILTPVSHTHPPYVPISILKPPFLSPFAPTPLPTPSLISISHTHPPSSLAPTITPTSHRFPSSGPLDSDIRPSPSTLITPITPPRPSSVASVTSSDSLPQPSGSATSNSDSLSIFTSTELSTSISISAVLYMKSSPSFTSTPNSTSHVNTSALVGGIVGGLGIVGLFLLTVILVYHFIRRSRRSKRNPLDYMAVLDLPQFRNTEPISHSLALTPNAPGLPSGPTPRPPTLFTINDPPNPMDLDAQEIDEFLNQSSLDNTFLQQDSMADQFTTPPTSPQASQPFQGFTRSISIRSNNPANFNSLLREILNPGRNQEGNFPSDIQIFLDSEPSNVEGLTSNNRESRGARFYRGHPSSSYTSVDAFETPPPSYESE